MRYRTFGYDGDGFCCYFYFQRFGYVNIGLHISFIGPNIEIHVPFGFFRIGWIEKYGIFARGWVWNDGRTGSEYDE